MLHFSFDLKTRCVYVCNSNVCLIDVGKKKTKNNNKRQNEQWKKTAHTKTKQKKKKKNIESIHTAWNKRVAHHKTVVIHGTSFDFTFHLPVQRANHFRPCFNSN